MSDLSLNELRRLDLTTLLVFLGLMRHRKALDVAAELGLTQSAISQALRRLRDIFGDDLFLRRPHGMEPTAIALALEPPIRAAVEGLRGSVRVARQFDPGAASGVVRVAALDGEQAVVIPPLAARLRALAPQLALSVLPLGRAAAMAALAEGRADLALGFVWNPPDGIAQAPLYREDFLVAGRPDALPHAPQIDLDAYCAAPHVLISPAGDMRGIVDDHLAALGRARHVGLAMPAFLPALAAVAESGALVTLPARLARRFAAGFGLVLADPPLAVRAFDISVFWHRRQESDPKTLWLRDQLRQIAL